MSKSLAEITKDAQSIELMLIESGGELTPELEAMLDANTDELAEKVDRYAHYIDRLERSEQYYSDKSEAYENIALGHENAILFLKDRIKSAMTALGASKIEGVEHKVSMSQTKGRLVLDEPNLSIKYVKEVRTLEPDKPRIRADLEAGQKIEGACIVYGHSLRITPNRKMVHNE